LDKKNVSLTVRLEESIAEEFKKAAQIENLSQADFLKKIFSESRNPKYNMLNNLQIEDHNIDSEMVVYLSKKNLLTTDENKRFLSTKAYKFSGRLIYPNPIFRRDTVPFRPATEYELLLRKDFDLGTDIDLELYVLFSYTNIYKITKDQRYLALEVIGLRQKDKEESDLYIERCKFIKDFSVDLKTEFPFSPEFEIRNISMTTAGEISEEDFSAYL